MKTTTPSGILYVESLPLSELSFFSLCQLESIFLVSCGGLVAAFGGCRVRVDACGNVWPVGQAIGDARGFRSILDDGERARLRESCGINLSRFITGA